MLKFSIKQLLHSICTAKNFRDCLRANIQISTIYTRLLQTVAGVGAPAVCRAIWRLATLPHEAFVFFAELHTRDLTSQLSKLIASPNTSSSQAVWVSWLCLKLHYTHPALCNIRHNLCTMSMAGKAVKFCWNLDDAGIRGNSHSYSQSHKFSNTCTITLCKRSLSCLIGLQSTIQGEVLHFYVDKSLIFSISIVYLRC